MATKSISSIRKKACIGDVIFFNRRGKNYEGKVFLVRPETVIVEISNKAAKMLGYERPNTVVRHGNYSIKASI